MHDATGLTRSPAATRATSAVGREQRPTDGAVRLVDVEATP